MWLVCRAAGIIHTLFIPKLITVQLFMPSLPEFVPRREFIAPCIGYLYDFPGYYAPVKIIMSLRLMFQELTHCKRSKISSSLYYLNGYCLRKKQQFLIDIYFYNITSYASMTRRIEKIWDGTQTPGCARIGNGQGNGGTKEQSSN